MKSSRTVSFFSVFLFAAVIIFLPLDPALAQDGVGGFVPCGGADCNFCHLMQLGNSVLNWLFTIVFVIFGVIMVAAGFELVTSGGNRTRLDDAKKKLTNALIGIIIMFAAWLLVDTLLKGVLNEEFVEELGPWNQISCDGGQVGFEQARLVVGDDSVREDDAWFTGTDGGTVDQPGELDHDTAAARLNDDISISSSGRCTDSSQSNCTSLEGVREQTIDRINELQEAVGVPIVITGGTEAGHSEGDRSHANGYKIDLRTTPALNEYIYNNFTQTGPTTYTDENGNAYYRHPPDHWDVTVTG